MAAGMSPGCFAACKDRYGIPLATDRLFCRVRGRQGFGSAAGCYASADESTGDGIATDSHARRRVEVGGTVLGVCRAVQTTNGNNLSTSSTAGCARHGSRSRAGGRPSSDGIFDVLSGLAPALIAGRWRTAAQVLWTVCRI